MAGREGEETRREERELTAAAHSRGKESRQQGSDTPGKGMGIQWEAAAARDTRQSRRFGAQPLSPPPATPIFPRSPADTELLAAGNARLGKADPGLAREGDRDIPAACRAGHCPQHREGRVGHRQEFFHGKGGQDWSFGLPIPAGVQGKPGRGALGDKVGMGTR